jgi:hypothetical protein
MFHLRTSYSRDYQNFCLLGYNTVESSEGEPPFMRNISTAYPGAKSKLNRKGAEAGDKKFGLIFDSEYRDSIFF